MTHFDRLAPAAYCGACGMRAEAFWAVEIGVADNNVWLIQVVFIFRWAPLPQIIYLLENSPARTGTRDFGENHVYASNLCPVDCRDRR